MAEENKDIDKSPVDTETPDVDVDVDVVTKEQDVERAKQEAEKVEKTKQPQPEATRGQIALGEASDVDPEEAMLAKGVSGARAPWIESVGKLKAMQAVAQQWDSTYKDVLGMNMKVLGAGKGEGAAHGYLDIQKKLQESTRMPDKEGLKVLENMSPGEIALEALPPSQRTQMMQLTIGMIGEMFQGAAGGQRTGVAPTSLAISTVESAKTLDENLKDNVNANRKIRMMNAKFLSQKHTNYSNAYKEYIKQFGSTERKILGQAINMFKGYQQSYNNQIKNRIAIAKGVDDAEAKVLQMRLDRNKANAINKILADKTKLSYVNSILAQKQAKNDLSKQNIQLMGLDEASLAKATEFFTGEGLSSSIVSNSMVGLANASQRKIGQDVIVAASVYAKQIKDQYNALRSVYSWSDTDANNFLANTMRLNNLGYPVDVAGLSQIADKLGDWNINLKDMTLMPPQELAKKMAEGGIAQASIKDAERMQMQAKLAIESDPKRWLGTPEQRQKTFDDLERLNLIKGGAKIRRDMAPFTNAIIIKDASDPSSLGGFK